MSVCIEQCNYRSNHNNFSQRLPAVDKVSKLSHQTNLKKGVLEQFKLWFSRSHQRKQLSQLDERMLKDIGYTSAQARAEHTKPFWK